MTGAEDRPRTAIRGTGRFLAILLLQPLLFAAIFGTYYKFAMVDGGLNHAWNNIVMVPVGLVAPLVAALLLRPSSLLQRLLMFVASSVIDFFLFFSLIAFFFDRGF